MFSHLWHGLRRPIGRAWRRPHALRRRAGATGLLHLVELACPQRRTCLQQCHAAAHDQQLLGFNAVALADLREQLGLGQAAATSLLRRVRAEKHRVYAPAHSGQLAVHLGVDGVEHLHVEQAAPQAGLVAGQHHVPARVVETRDGIERARLGDPLVW